MKTGKERRTYFVELPDVDTGVQVYGSIPRRGVTVATTNKGAVAQYVMRHVKGVAGQNILHNLKERSGDLGIYSFEEPQLEIDSQEVMREGTETGISSDMYKLLEECALAADMAEVDGRHPNGHIGRARELLAA